MRPINTSYVTENGSVRAFHPKGMAVAPVHLTSNYLFCQESREPQQQSRLNTTSSHRSGSRQCRLSVPLPHPTFHHHGHFSKVCWERSNSQGGPGDFWKDCRFNHGKCSEKKLSVEITTYTVHKGHEPSALTGTTVPQG